MSGRTTEGVAESSALSTVDGRPTDRPPHQRALPPREVDYNNRLSRTGPERLVFYFTNAFCAFWAVGFLRARRLSAHQFLAENSHRLPTSDAGWYLYHRAKNYRTLWNGIKGGFRYGFLGGGTAYLYGYIEEFWDQDVRGGKVDALGSLVAGTVTAGLFGLWKGFGARMAWRYLRVGMALGLLSGVVQDSIRWAGGATPWYVKELQERPWAWTSRESEARKT